MGNETSLPMSTNFDPEEIKRLGRRFKKLDIDSSGALSSDEFMALPELQQNPLVQRVIDIFDAVSHLIYISFLHAFEWLYNINYIARNCIRRVRFAFFLQDNNGEVDFKEFINGVSQFSVRGDKEQKLRFAFCIYDMDRDGYISNGELFQVLKMMVGNNLKDNQLQQIVDKTIMYADKDEDGKISFPEFAMVVGNLDIHKKLVVEV